MPGALIIVVVLVVAIPVGVLMTGAVIAGIIGWLVQRDVAEEHAGSELLELNR